MFLLENILSFRFLQELTINCLNKDRINYNDHFNGLPFFIIFK